MVAAWATNEPTWIESTKDILSNISAGKVLIWDGAFNIDELISIEGGGWINSFTLRHVPQSKIEMM